MSGARAPEAGRPASPRVGLVTSRHRLCAALGRPLDDALDLLVAQMDGAAAAGVEFMQVREPDLDGRTLLALVRRLHDASHGRVRVVVNDRADVAAAAGVDLHLKGVSMPPARVRPWMPVSTWISRAVHSAADARDAGDVDALVAGTVHLTPSKPADAARLGLAGLADLVAATARPVFAIGGLTARDWAEVAATGAAGIAAIGWMLPRAGEDAADAVVRAMRAMRAVVDAPRGVS